MGVSEPYNSKLKVSRNKGRRLGYEPICRVLLYTLALSVAVLSGVLQHFHCTVKLYYKKYRYGHVIFVTKFGSSFCVFFISNEKIFKIKVGYRLNY